MIVRAKAHIDAAFDGQADAVARRAEIVAERRDQAERHGAVLDREIARGTAGPLVDRINGARLAQRRDKLRSEEHTSELQSLMRISYAVFCLKKKKKKHDHQHNKTAEYTPRKYTTQL